MIDTVVFAPTHILETISSNFDYFKSEPPLISLLNMEEKLISASSFIVTECNFL